MQLIKFERRFALLETQYINGRKPLTGLIRKLSEGQSFFYNPNYPVNFPCGWKPEYPEKTYSFRQSVD